MIRGYMRSRRGQLLLFVCALVIFPLVFYLYGVPRGAAWYSLAIFAFLYLLYTAADLCVFCARLKRLREAADSVTSYMADLPRPSDAAQEQYERIIGQVYGLLHTKLSALAAEQADRIDYYTMWLHQIKTPISAMRLVLDSEPFNASLCNQELFKIERYVEMALQYARMDSMASDLLVERVSLHALATQCVRRYSTLFICKKLSVDITGDSPEVSTDAKWCEFIIGQLLSNAIKYTPSGGRITLDVTHRTLTVSDTGIGILPQDLPRVFERGYSGYNGRLDKRASGLGLYMAKRVADTLSADLSISSEKGRGTRVTLSFPADLETE